MENAHRIQNENYRFADIAQSYNRFIDIIHFTETISTAIHGLQSEADIFNVVKNTFAQSKDYASVILKLNADKGRLELAAVSLPEKKLRLAEKVGNFKMSNFSIKLHKSQILRRVISDGETVHFQVRELIGEFFPKTIVNLIWKVGGFREKSSVVTPLIVKGEIVGAFSMNCPDFVKEFIPTAKNLAQHISYALELANENEERRKAEEDKALLEEQLRQAEKLKSIGELAGGVAHDFNNMLGAIAGYVDLIDEDNRDERGTIKDATLGRYIETINRATQRAVDLISKLLAFSRRGKYRNETLNMHDVLNDVLVLLDGTIGTNIIIDKKMDAEKFTIKGDPSQIQNALINIAINARDAMPEGGSLIISTLNETLEKGERCVDCAPGEYLKISISDTGKGMDDEVQGKVFEPFFSTKEVGEGSGLGLASVYGTMQMHDGGINVLSARGVGSTFNLYFPVSADEVEDKVITGKRIMEKGEGTVVIVDDEEMITDMVSNLLTKCGYTVHTFCDGFEAIGWYERHYPEVDLLILDMIMPAIDGVECYERLSEINPDIKVIIASGYSRNNKVQKLINQGAVLFIEKPFDKVSLSKMVAQVIQEKEDRVNSNARIIT